MTKEEEKVAASSRYSNTGYIAWEGGEEIKRLHGLVVVWNYW